MAIDPFIQAGAGVPAGTDRDAMELAFYRARSGIADQTLSVSIYKQAYFRRILGAPGAGLDIDTLSSMFKTSGVKDFRRNRIGNPRGVSILDGSELKGVNVACTTSVETVNTAGFGNSVKLSPNTGPGANDSYIAFGDVGALRNGMTPGKTYTVSGTVILTAAQTGSLIGSGRARKLVVFWNSGGYVETQSAAGPNAAGATRVSLTFTLPAGATEAFIRFYNGSDTATDAVYWTGLLLEESATLNDFFDGASGGCSWEGAANASLSSGYPGVNK